MGLPKLNNTGMGRRDNDPPSDRDYKKEIVFKATSQRDVERLSINNDGGFRVNNILKNAR